MTKIELTVDGAHRLRRRRAAHAARAVPPREARQDRHRDRLRHQQLRCLHRPPRRQEREVAATCWPSRPTGTRSPPSRASPQDGELHPVQEAFRECHAPPVRLLHAGDDHAERRPAQRQPEPLRGGDPGRHRGQPLSLHRLPQHRQGGLRPQRRRCRSDRHRGAPRHRGEGDRPRPSPQGGPAADHRPHPLDRQHHAPGHAAPRDGAQPVRPREDHLDRHRGGEDVAQRRRRAHRRRPRRGAGRLHQRLGDHHRPGRPRRTCRCPSTGSPSPARPSPSWWRAAPPPPATPPSWSTSSTTSCRPRSTSRSPRRDEVLAHPDLGTNKSAFWKFDSAEAGTGGNVDEAIEKARGDGIVIEREYRQQRLIPAFMEPRSTVVDPTGEQITMWSATQIPHILRFALAATTGVPESKIRVIAPDVGGGFGGKLQQHAGGDDHLRGGPPARQAGEVHRDPVRVADGRPPRARPVAEAHPGRDQGRHGHRPQGRPARRPRCLRRASSVAACRCSARSCSTRSTSSRPTSSTARRCSPTRPGRTPTAAPAGRRRRTPSSG